MIVLDKRPEHGGFDERLRGYNGSYCYYDELSRWERARLDSCVFVSLFTFWFY